MSDLMLLERLEETLSSQPDFELPSPRGSAVDELREQSRFIIKKGEEWLGKLNQDVAHARKHPLHRKEFSKLWAHLEPTLSRAIKTRENGVRQIDELLDRASHLKGKEAREITGYAQTISLYLAKEQRGLVAIYYLLKADADEAANDTQGDGAALSTPDDIKAYFKRIRTA